MGADPGAWYPVAMVVMTRRGARVCWFIYIYIYIYIYSFRVVILQVIIVIIITIITVQNLKRVLHTDMYNF